MRIRLLLAAVFGRAQAATDAAVPAPNAQVLDAVTPFSVEAGEGAGDGVAAPAAQRAPMSAPAPSPLTIGRAPQAAGETASSRMRETSLTPDQKAGLAACR